MCLQPYALISIEQDLFLIHLRILKLIIVIEQEKKKRYSLSDSKGKTSAVY